MKKFLSSLFAVLAVALLTPCFCACNAGNGGTSNGGTSAAPIKIITESGIKIAKGYGKSYGKNSSDFTTKQKFDLPHELEYATMIREDGNIAVKTAVSDNPLTGEMNTSIGLIPVGIIKDGSTESVDKYDIEKFACVRTVSLHVEGDWKHTLTTHILVREEAPNEFTNHLLEVLHAGVFCNGEWISSYSEEGCAGYGGWTEYKGDDGLVSHMTTSLELKGLPAEDCNLSFVIWFEGNDPQDSSNGAYIINRRLEVNGLSFDISLSAY